MGSVTALTDAKGKVVQEYDYDSFGNLKNQKNRIKQPYTFTGREYDRETGLYYYRARYYDPVIGRFISKDPIGFKSGEINFYKYAENNPIMNTDPSGKVVRRCQRALGSSSFRFGPFHHSYLDVDGQLYGFHPKNDELFGPGSVRSESPGNDISCGKPIECIDEQCVKNKIVQTFYNPPNYYFGIFDCRSWTEMIIILCKR